MHLTQFAMPGAVIFVACYDKQLLHPGSNKKFLRLSNRCLVERAGYRREVWVDTKSGVVDIVWMICLFICALSQCVACLLFLGTQTMSPVSISAANCRFVG
jgi:hypothetical protein